MYGFLWKILGKNPNGHSWADAFTAWDPFDLSNWVVNTVLWNSLDQINFLGAIARNGINTTYQ